MGKKKKHRGAQDGAAAAGGFPMAGLFAAAAAQANSPVGRQVIAGALRRAADAIDRRGIRAAPAGDAPQSPVSPTPPEAPAQHASSPPPATELPPEVARVIGSVTAGLERWAAKIAPPRG